MIKTFAKVVDGVVVNTAIAEDAWPFQDDPHIEVPEGAVISVGWLYDGSNFAAPAPALPETSTINTTPLKFIGLFTAQEQNAIATAALSNAQLFLWFNKLTAAQTIIYSDVQLAEGMAALVSYGLITQARSEEILPLNVRSSGVTPL